jgi:hypothetical protein
MPRRGFAIQDRENSHGSIIALIALGLAIVFGLLAGSSQRREDGPSHSHAFRNASMADNFACLRLLHNPNHFDAGLGSTAIEGLTAANAQVS